MSNITILADDSSVTVDGPTFVVDLTGLDPTISVVQWDDTVGHIEYRTVSGVRTPNLVITDLTPFQHFIDLWTAANAAYTPFMPPSPTEFLVAPSLVAAAFGLVITPGSEDISNPSGGGLYNVAGTSYLGVGSYWVFFINSLLSTDYYMVASGNTALMVKTDATGEYFTITVTDPTTHDPVDPAELSFQVFKIPS